jgi:hypothetical protein
MLIATAIAAALMGNSSPAAVSRPPESPGPSPDQQAMTTSATRSSRPNRADWEKIKTAARLRRMALAPHRTALFRAFTASLGLSELISIRPLAPGRCRTAVTYLYDNLLDLEHAFRGENWDPLRRAVAKEPSIDACAPRPRKRQDVYLVVA